MEKAKAEQVRWEMGKVGKRYFRYPSSNIN